MLSVVAALDVSLDIFSTGRRAFRFTTTRKSRLFYEVRELTQLYTRLLRPSTPSNAVGVVFRRFEGTTTTHLPRTNTKNTDDFPRRHDTVERG